MQAYLLPRAVSGLALATALAAVPALAFEPGATECIAPAAPGGGWDFTCRQVGKTLQDLGLVPGTMQVTNIAGALAEVVNKRYTDDNLIVAVSTSTAPRLAQGSFPPWQHDGSRALARFRDTDYGIIAVAEASPINTPARAHGRDP